MSLIEPVSTLPFAHIQQPIKLLLIDDSSAVRYAIRASILPLEAPDRG
jgi:hypothetical protein